MTTDLALLTPYFQIIVAINLAPSLSRGIFNSYGHIVKSLIKSKKDDLNEANRKSIDKRFAEFEKNIEGLKGLGNEQLEKIAGAEIENQKKFFEIQSDSLKDLFQQIVFQETPQFEKKLEEDEKNLTTSFILSALYTIVLVLFPILFLIRDGAFCLQWFYIMVGIISIVFMASQAYIMTWKIKSPLIPASLFFLFCLLILVLTSYYSPKTCEINCAFAYSKYIVYSSLFLSIFTFVAFPLRYLRWMSAFEKNVDSQFLVEVELAGLADFFKYKKSFWKNMFGKK